MLEVQARPSWMGRGWQRRPAGCGLWSREGRGREGLGTVLFDLRAGRGGAGHCAL